MMRYGMIVLYQRKVWYDPSCPESRRDVSLNTKEYRLCRATELENLAQGPYKVTALDDC